MNKQTEWIARQQRLGLTLLAVGVVLFLVGLAVQLLVQDLSFNPRIISGLGILAGGMGAGYLTRSAAGRKDPTAARQLRISEQDERLRQLRGRAGLRAFWVALAWIFALLMWVSFAANGSLPTPNLDSLWWALAAAFVVPMLVFLVSLSVDNARE